MLATAVRRATIQAQRAARAPTMRTFSSEFSEIRRPKAIKVKKGEARRRVEPKPKHEPGNAIVEHQDASQAPVQYTQSPFPPEPPQTFGGAMKQSFLWGIGMALAFSIVGAVFSIMEESDHPGKYDASFIMTSESETHEE